MEYPWRDEDILRKLYWEKEMSQYDIAAKLGCSPRTVRTWMDKHGVESRSTSDAVLLSESANHTSWQDKELLEKLYCDRGLSITEIAEELGCGHNTIHKWLERHGIETQKPPQEKPAHFGTYDGYEKWRCDVDGVYHSVSVHRLLAVAEYGFESVKDKVVHHENYIPWDNRPDNITLMERANHSAHHNSTKSQQ